MVFVLRTKLTSAMAALAGALVLLAPSAAPAQTSEQQGLDDAYRAAGAAMVPGPAAIPLLDQGTLNIGREYGFVPQKEARQLMLAMGNATGDGTIGLILPRSGEGHWFITVGFNRIGYARPSALIGLGAQAIYDEMKRAVARGNEHRLELEAGKIYLAGYIEKPAYDAQAHRMFLATKLVAQGPSDDQDDSANLDAYVFGREGVITMTLATSASAYDSLRRHMDQAYYGVSFLPGKQPKDALKGDRNVEYPLETIFGGRTAEEINDEKAKAAHKALLEKQNREAAAAAAAAAADANQHFWMMTGLGVLLLAGGAAGAFALFGRRPGQAQGQPAVPAASGRQPSAVSTRPAALRKGAKPAPVINVNRALRGSRTG